MVKNVGKGERWIRLAGGAVLLVAAFAYAGPGAGRWTLAVVGLIALATGGTSY